MPEDDLNRILWRAMKGPKFRIRWAVTKVDDTTTEGDGFEAVGSSPTRPTGCKHFINHPTLPDGEFHNHRADRMDERCGETGVHLLAQAGDENLHRPRVIFVFALPDAFAKFGA